MGDWSEVQARQGKTGLEKVSTEVLVGEMCFYKSRCEGSHRAHFHDREPGKSMLTMISMGYAVIGELIKRMNEKDWDWYANFFRSIEAVK